MAWAGSRRRQFAARVIATLTFLTFSDFASLFVFTSLSALFASDLSWFQGPKVMRRWALAKPASRRWGRCVAWGARGPTVGAIAGAARELRTCHVPLRAGRVAIGQGGGQHAPESWARWRRGPRDLWGNAAICCGGPRAHRARTSPR